MTHMFRTSTRVPLVTALLALVAPAALSAQPPSDQDGSTQDPLRFRTPTITVTAQKEEEDKQRIPVSVTAASSETIAGAGIRIISDASLLAPNTFFTEWSARKLSTARFRGLGSSPNNPAITTYIDGVPQLSENSTSIELLDVEQIEFVRGPQSALFGRNTLGGLVNVTSLRPSLAEWTGSASVPFGNYGAWGLRGGANGPVLNDRMSLGVSFAQIERNGFTVNDITGNDIDTRSATSGKIQLLWLPNDNWEGRVIVTAERARDGDYALNDIGALRANPFHAARDFEGRVDRDVVGTTVLARRVGGSIELTSTTGFLNWETRDITDLDYSPIPIAVRDNTEDSFQFTQELRIASADTASIALSDQAALRWQAGVSFFNQSYNQDAINSYAAGLFAPIAVDQHTPRAALDSFGVGVFGQGVVTLNARLDLAAGARFDFEDKSALIESFIDQFPVPPTGIDADDSFSNVSPQLSATYRVMPDQAVYATVSRGYKAGGFNPASPAGSESYGEEFSLNVEGGYKALWADGRLSANAAVFFIDWDDLQLNVPDPAVPAQFYISNVGGASSKGVEFEVAARAMPGLDLFSAVGFTHARFSEGASSFGLSLEGNELPNTPEYTASLGAQYMREVGPTTVTGRFDTVFYGAFQYDDFNSLGQDSYALTNFRFAICGGMVTAELAIRNAFDTRYIPVAFAYPNFAPSGFMGEMGAPRTVSVSAGFRF